MVSVVRQATINYDSFDLPRAPFPLNTTHRQAIPKDGSPKMASSIHMIPYSAKDRKQEAKFLILCVMGAPRCVVGNGTI
jgi:hypothetical protein